MSWLALVAASMGVASCYVRGRERAIIASFCVTATILQALDGAPALGAMGLGMVLAGALARARGVALSGLCVVNSLWLLGLPALPVMSTAALLAMATLVTLALCSASDHSLVAARAWWAGVCGWFVMSASRGALFAGDCREVGEVRIGPLGLDSAAALLAPHDCGTPLGWFFVVAGLAAAAFARRHLLSVLFGASAAVAAGAGGWTATRLGEVAGDAAGAGGWSPTLTVSLVAAALMGVGLSWDARDQERVVAGAFPAAVALVGAGVVGRAWSWWMGDATHAAAPEVLVLPIGLMALGVALMAEERVSRWLIGASIAALGGISVLLLGGWA